MNKNNDTIPYFRSNPRLSLNINLQTKIISSSYNQERPKQKLPSNQHPHSQSKIELSPFLNRYDLINADSIQLSQNHSKLFGKSHVDSQMFGQIWNAVDKKILSNQWKQKLKQKEKTMT